MQGTEEEEVTEPKGNGWKTLRLCELVPLRALRLFCQKFLARVNQVSRALPTTVMPPWLTW